MKLNELFEAGPYNIDWNRVARESLPLFMLAQDIKENGIKEPILLKDGKVVDGIHRVFVLWLMGYKGDVPTKEVEL
jgi:ParB-like chromosome segregation protein Spo0J